MHTHDDLSRYLAVGLSALAGFVDALGFLSLGGFFVSFMSGNSTRFAVGAASGMRPSLVLVPLAMIALFVAGVMAGRIVRHFARRHPSVAILALVTAMLVAAGLAAETDQALPAAAFMAIAMGASNNVFAREGEVSIGVTYMTGTLVKFGQRLASAMLGHKNTGWFPYLMLWAGLVAGALLGALGYRHWGLHALWAAAIFAAGLTPLGLRVERGARQQR